MSRKYKPTGKIGLFDKQFAAQQLTEMGNPLDLHSHQWRHAKACHWLDDGINIVEISKLLGHESIETTMGYQDITTEQQMRALATLEDEATSAIPKKWKLEKNIGLSELFGFTRPQKE